APDPLGLAHPVQGAQRAAAPGQQEGPGEAMKGKTVLITGANTGIGYSAALELARRGAAVVLGCRDKGRGEAAVAAIRVETGNTAVELLLLDLASLASVRAAAAAFEKRH